MTPVEAAAHFARLNQRTALEDRLDALIVWMHRHGLRCTELTPELLRRRGVFVGLPAPTAVLTDPAFFEQVYTTVASNFRLVLHEATAAAYPDVVDAQSLVSRPAPMGRWLTTGRRFTVDDPVRDHPVVVLNGRVLPAMSTHVATVTAACPWVRPRSTNVRDLPNLTGLDQRARVVFANALGRACFLEAWANISRGAAVDQLAAWWPLVYEHDEANSRVRRLR